MDSKNNIIDERKKQSEKKPLINFTDIYQRFKKIKNIEVIICIILIAVILLAYSAHIKIKNKKVEKTVSVEQVTSSYIETERKLAEILSSIKGAGKVKVLITYDGSSRLVTAETSTINTTTRTDNSGGSNLTVITTDETTTPVLVVIDGKTTPLILKEINPKIEGVIIVAEGADDIKVRLEILQATATALNINKNIIQIFTMNN